MSRPLRIEFSGAVYHVTSRGDRREDIYLDDGDRQLWLDTLGEACNRFGWIVHSYCLMTNHYHLLIETPNGNLSRGMRHLNGVYTQRFNRKHKLSGHLYQGRFKAILVQADVYLLELSRYIVLNPIRANMITVLSAWEWSSYPAMVGLVVSPDWLARKPLLLQFDGNLNHAVTRYTDFIKEGVNKPSVWGHDTHKSILGDERFIESIRTQYADIQDKEVTNRAQIRQPLNKYIDNSQSKSEAMAKAYLFGSYTMKEIGSYFGVHYVTVSRAVKQYECKT